MWQIKNITCIATDSQDVHHDEDGSAALVSSWLECKQEAQHKDCDSHVGSAIEDVP